MSVKPKAGDLIEIFRPMYQHWAIYVGDGYVIHLVPPYEVANAGANSVMSVFCEMAVVKKEKLLLVVGTDKYKVNNLLDDTYEPREVSEILKHAHSLVDQKKTYNLATANCEHFVTDLRYGKPTSRQVRQVASAAALGVLGVVGVVGVVAVTVALFSDSEKEKRNKY